MQIELLPHRIPLWLVLLGMILCESGIAAFAQESKLKPSELEIRLKEVRKAYYGDQPLVLLAAPWTEDRLRAELNSQAKRLLDAHTDPAADHTAVPLQTILHINVLTGALSRQSLAAEQPPRQDRDLLLAWADALITRYRVVLADGGTGIDMLGRYAAYKRAHNAAFEPARAAEIMQALSDLEANIATREKAGRVAYLEFLVTQPPPDVPRETIQLRLTEARRSLPDALEELELKDLRKQMQTLEGKIQGNALAGLTTRAYLALLVSEYTATFAKERAIKTCGSGDLERRDLQRRRAQTSSELCDLTNDLGQRRIDSLRLVTLRGHLGYEYGEQLKHKPGETKGIPDGASIQTFFDTRAASDLKQLRGLLTKAEDLVLKSTWLMNVEHWWVKRGRDLPGKLIDSLIDDGTQWLEKFPASRRTVKQELLEIAGFPAGKERFEKLNAEERAKVLAQMNRSLNDIRDDFNKDVFYLLRQDFELLEELTRSYPAKQLLSVKKPEWPAEPKERLRLTDCHDLSNAAAARAYLRIFEQIDKDWETFCLEYTRYIMAVDLNASMHLRLAAGE